MLRWLFVFVLLARLSYGMDASVRPYPLDSINDGLILACISGNVRKVRQLLKRPHVPAPAQSTEIRARIDRVLSKNIGSRLTSEQARCPLCVATFFNRPAIVKALLKSKRFRTSPTRFSAIILASRFGLKYIVNFLLRKSITYPSAILNSALIQACTYAHVGVVRLLLEIDFVDPSHLNNSALIAACSRGYFKVTNLLLKDARVDPSYPDNEPLLAAIGNMHFKIVGAVLYSANVDPSLMNGEALRLATELEDERIIRILLRDPRLYPFIDAILGDHLRVSNFSHEIAALLFAHTPSRHIYGSPRNYRLFQCLLLCKAGNFVLHDNQHYSFELLEQLLRCETSLSRFDAKLLKRVLDTNRIFDNVALHDTLNFVVIRCCGAGNQGWLRDILNLLATRLSPWQLEHFIWCQKAVMNLDLANLLLIALAHAEVSLYFVRYGAADLLPLVLKYQFDLFMQNYTG